MHQQHPPRQCQLEARRRRRWRRVTGGACRASVSIVVLVVILGGCNARPTPDDPSAGATGEEPAANDGPSSTDEPTTAASAQDSDSRAPQHPADGVPASSPQRIQSPEDAANAGAEAGAAKGIENAAPAPAATYTVDGPLTGTAKAAFWGSPTDPPTEELMGITEEFEGRHYVIGDEYYLDLWYPHVEDLGGGYMGVGADQAYIFIGWQKPELAWLIDYDEWVIGIHRAHQIFFREAETVDAFMGYWYDKDKGRPLLEEKLAEDDPWREMTLTMYKRYRVSTRIRIRRLVERFEAVGVPSVYHDQETYAFVRQLILEDRVRPMLTNLLDDEGVIGIGAVARELDVPIRVLYVSNAEEYWDYPDQYRENINALHFDEKSLLLRTLSTWQINKDYQYAIQPAQQYAAWLQRDWVKRRAYMVRRVREFADDDTLKTPLIITDEPIEEVEERRRKRKQRRKRRSRDGGKND